MEGIVSENMDQQSPLNITEQFLSMSSIDFNNFLREHKNDTYLEIVINWDDSNSRLTEYMTASLKAFLENNRNPNQKRIVIIRATKKQKDGQILGSSMAKNAFASGVKWEEI